MENNILLLHLNDKLALFHLYFNKTMESMEMEDIHELRVNIKKLKTIWSLIQEASYGRWKMDACFDLCTNLFRVAGEVREAQINLEIIEHNPSPFLIPFVQHLKDSQKQSSQQLIETMLMFDMEKLKILNNELSKNMQDLSNEIVLKESVAFAIKMTLNVIELKDQFQDEHNLHQLRIQQKAVQELLGIIMKLHTDSALSKLKDQIKLFNEEIGNWHDYRILLQSLNEFLKKSQNTKNGQHVKSFIEGIEKEQEIKQTRLYELLNKHIAPLQLSQIENLLQ